MDAFIGEIRVFPWSFPPYGWLTCDGSSVPIMQQQALYGVIGAMYGGDTRNFNLPNLMGRVPMGTGNGPGLTPRTIGQSVGGVESVALRYAEMAAHTHGMTMLNAAQATTTSAPTAATSLLTRLFSGNGINLCKNFLVGSTTTPNSTLSPLTIGVVGTGAAHENRQPVLAMNFCICVIGEYPVHQ